MDKVPKIELNVVVGHIKNNMEKKRKQFNLSKKHISMLKYLYDDMGQTDHISYSAIVETALETYHKLYTSVQKIEGIK